MNLKQVIAKWNVVYFSSIRVDVLETSLFISTYQTSVEIITPRGVYQGGDRQVKRRIFQLH